MDTTIQPSYYQYLKDFVEQNLTLLRTNRVYIFGAGYRGCNLLQLLHLFQISDIVFVDNDAKKQGLKIEGCPIISFSQASLYSGKHIFLCPVENGVQILNQLKESGRAEGKDYFNLDFQTTDYLQVIEELQRPAPDYSILLGCCRLSSCILGDYLAPPLGEVLREKLYNMTYKVCALPGVDPIMDFYMILSAANLHKKLPLAVVMDLTLSSISPYEALMLETQNYRQHILFLEQFADIIPQDTEIKEYLETLCHRMERSQRRQKLKGTDQSNDSLRQVYKLKYQYNLREDNPSVICLQKILKKMNRENIPVTIIFHPIDYQRGERILGPDFSTQYASNVQKFKSFLEGYQYAFIDATFIAASEYFVPPTLTPDINPILNVNGRKLLIAKLKSQVDMQ